MLNDDDDAELMRSSDCHWVQNKYVQVRLVFVYVCVCVCVNLNGYGKNMKNCRSATHIQQQKFRQRNLVCVTNCTKFHKLMMKPKTQICI